MRSPDARRWIRRTYDHRHLVTLEETSAVGDAYYTSYLRWQGHCQERFVAEQAPEVRRALDYGLALVTVSCRCDYFGGVHAFDVVETRMRLVEVEANLVTLAFDHYRVGEHQVELAARGEQVLACMRRVPGGTRPTPVPAELRAAFMPYRDGTKRVSVLTP